MSISIICAMALNREIGKDNKLLWNLPSDLAYFKQLTSNRIVLMGRLTYESIISKLGKPLPDRTNIVITSDLNYKSPYDNVYIFNSIEEFLYDYNTYGDRDEEVFICGGSKVYEQLISYADKLYLTIVDAEFPDADTFFPPISDEWKVASRADISKDEKNKYNHSFLIYEKK